MKLLYKSFNMLAVSTLLAFSFGVSSCSDDEPKTEDKFTTEYTFEAEFSTDLIATADVKAYVLSPEGTVTEETVTKESQKHMDSQGNFHT